MATVNYQEKGVVFDIQRFSVNDGPGIRSIVFLKGCPLACLWCCNPESQRIEPDVMYDQQKCIGCGKCAEVCRQNAIGSQNASWIDRTKCIGCGECATICPTGALTLKGETETVNEVIQVLKRDSHFFRKSGGGVTLSGGEPLMQWRFAKELLMACKAQGWDTAMETTGLGTQEAIDAVIPYVDLVLLDCKSTDSDVHRRVTGVNNEQIIANAHRIVSIAKETVVRVPTIPTVNASEEEFHRIAEYAKSLNVDTVHILPYHTLGESKYAMLGKAYEMGYEIKTLPREEAEIYKKVIQSHGLNCVIGG
ncbi:glycyl-radical enzyme activating protein [Hornefia butyriciproducens]|uniref:glycyl-radical enzyme activating protein n=1 Tax=Hornefia butyriciproducens TaxID=2652293 RepID=UPI002A75D389|nr:glycyl-radical enzyme activating protein [Hornefia butyriciproducens]MCI7327783.1 glycyl-radical enzyme activating protein [Clostridiales bacterium]MDY2991269.1 glycyl-radical enzyme activating protein [Hornefia butyriciproducens]MDY6211428.1 glycyl-radical enzyme activating protein [Hornefia butyriciproducens]